MYHKKENINELKEGEYLEDIFVVKIKKALSSYAKGFRIDLVLTDSSGASLNYVYWGSDKKEEVEEIHKAIKEDSVLLIKGTVGSYGGKLQLSANGLLIPKVLEFEEYDADFIMKSKKDLNDLSQKFKIKIDSIQDLKLKKFVKEIFDEIGEDFFKSPGAIQIHHNWIGGLLEHTLEVISFCETTYLNFPQLNRDLLLAGAFLHDIGKLQEIEMTSRIKGTTKGQLIGHLIIGTAQILNKLENSELEENVQSKLIHLLVSHHGKLENGSPKEAMIPEAIALYYADELSSKLAEIIAFKEEHIDKTEDDFMFNYRHQRNIFLR